MIIKPKMKDLVPPSEDSNILPKIFILDQFEMNKIIDQTFLVLEHAIVLREYINQKFNKSKDGRFIKQYI